jgi:hypothetical protein
MAYPAAKCWLFNCDFVLIVAMSLNLELLFFSNGDEFDRLWMYNYSLLKP